MIGHDDDALGLLPTRPDDMAKGLALLAFLFVSAVLVLAGLLGLIVWEVLA